MPKIKIKPGQRALISPVFVNDIFEEAPNDQGDDDIRLPIKPAVALDHAEDDDHHELVEILDDADIALNDFNQVITDPTITTPEELQAALNRLIPENADNGQVINIDLPELTALFDGQQQYSRGVRNLNDFLQRRDVAPMPELVAVLNAEPVRTKLIGYFATPHNVPLPAQVIILRNAISGVDLNQEPELLNNIINNLFEANLLHADHLEQITRQNIRNAIANAPQVNNEAITPATIKGAARLQAFITRPDVASMPRLVALMNHPDLRTALVAHFADNAPPADLNAMLLAIHQADGNPGNTVAAVIALHLLGNRQNQAPVQQAIAAAQVNGVRIDDAQLQGEARFQQFIAQPGIAIMPRLVAIMSHPQVQAHLVAHFADPINQPPAHLNALLQAVNQAGANPNEVSNAIAAALPGVGAQHQADVHVAVAANMQVNAVPVTEAQLRGEARFQQFIAQPRIAALPRLVAVMSHPRVQAHLVAHFATHPFPANLDPLLQAISQAGANQWDVSHAIARTLPSTDVNNQVLLPQIRQDVQAAITATNLPGADLAAGEVQLRGEARLQRFLNRSDMRAMPELVQLLNREPLRALLIGHLGVHNIADPATLATQLRGNIIAAAAGGNDVFNAIAGALPGNVQPAQVQTAGTQDVAAGRPTAITEDSLRGAARLQAFATHPDVAAMPELAQLLNREPLRARLIGHLGVHLNQIPNLADLANRLRIDIIAAGAGGNDVFNAIAGALPGVGNPGHQDTQTAGTQDVAAGRPTAITENSLRGAARLQAFATHPDVAAMPELAQLLNREPLRARLIGHLGVPLDPIPNLADLANQLRIDIIAAGAAGNDVFNAIADRLPGVGNAGHQDTQTAGTQDVAAGRPTAITEDSLRGAARLQAFATHPDVAAMPELAQLLNREPLRALLIGHLGDHGHRIADPATLATQLRRDIIAAAAGGNNVFNAIAGALPGNVQAAQVQVAGAQQPVINQDSLRGAARLQEFLKRPDVAAMQELVAVLKQPPVRDLLVTRFGGNDIPSIADVINLRNQIIFANAGANAIDAAIADHIIPGNPVNAIAPDNVRVAREAAAVPNPLVTEANIRGAARLQEFLTRPDINATQELAQLLNRAPLRASLIAHLSVHAIVNQDLLASQLLTGTTTAALANNAVFQSIATTLVDVSAPPITVANVQAAAAANAAQGLLPITEAGLRGAARLQAFLTDPLIAAMPELVAVLNTPPVRTQLANYYADPNRRLPTPIEIAHIRNTIANPDLTIADGVARAIASNLPGNLNSANVTAAINLAGLTEVHLLAATRFEQFIRRDDVAAMPHLVAVLSAPALKVLLKTHFENNALPTPAVLAHLRTQIAAAGDAPAVATAIVDYLNGDATNPAAIAQGRILGIDGVAVNQAIVDAANVNGQPVTADLLRGEARYQKMLVENKAILDTMPQLKALLEKPDVKSALIVHWGGAAIAEPAYATAIQKLREEISALPEGSLPAVAIAAFSKPEVFGPGINNLDLGLQNRITNAAEVTALRREANTSILRTTDDEAIRLREVLYTRFKELRNTTERIFKANKSTHSRYLSIPSRLALRNAASNLRQDLPPNHDLAKKIEKQLTAIDALPLLNKQQNPTPDQHQQYKKDKEEYFKKLDELLDSWGDVLEEHIKLQKSVDNIVSNQDRGSASYKRMAEYNQDQVEKLRGSISETDVQEIERIRQANEKMLYVINLAEVKLNKNLNEAEPWKTAQINQRINEIKACRDILNQTAIKIEQAQTLGPVQNVNTYSSRSEVFRHGTPNAEPTAIADKTAAFFANFAPGAGAVDGILLNHDGAKTTSRFDNGDVRYSETDLYTVDDRDADPITIKPSGVVSTQSTKNGVYGSDVRYIPADIANMPLNQLVKIAAVEVENYYAGLADKSSRIVLGGRGAANPKLARAIIMYCEIKGYPTPICSGSVRPEPEKKKSWLGRGGEYIDIDRNGNETTFNSYKEAFKHVLDTQAIEIFPPTVRAGNNTTMGMSATERNRLERDTKTTPDVPRPRF